MLIPACACSADTPALRRANTAKNESFQSSNPLRMGVICPFIVMGTKMSGVWPTWMPLKPAFATPTMVISVLFTRIV